jgi:hypothetical protein
MISTNFARSSVERIPQSGVPSTLVSVRRKTPRSASAMPQFSAVWPPKERSTPSGRSASRIGSTNSAVSGWK